MAGYVVRAAQTHGRVFKFLTTVVTDSEYRNAPNLYLYLVAEKDFFLL